MHRLLYALASILLLTLAGCASQSTPPAPKETCTAVGDPKAPQHYLCGNGGSEGVMKSQDGWRFAADQAAGRWIEIRYPQSEWIRTLYVDNGCSDGTGSVKEVEVTTPDGQLLRFQLEANRDDQMITLPQWAQVRSFRMSLVSPAASGASCLRHVRADIKEQYQDQLAMESCDERTPKSGRVDCLRELRVKLQEAMRRQAAKLPAGKLRNGNEQWRLWAEQECDALSRLTPDGTASDGAADRCLIEHINQRIWQLRQMNDRLAKRSQ